MNFELNFEFCLYWNRSVLTPPIHPPHRYVLIWSLPCIKVIDVWFVQWWTFVVHLNLLCRCVCILHIAFYGLCASQICSIGTFFTQTPWVWNPKVYIPPLDGLIWAFLWNVIKGAGKRGTGFWLSVQNTQDI